jgi:hypothetical protein
MTNQINALRNQIFVRLEMHQKNDHDNGHHEKNAVSHRGILDERIRDAHEHPESQRDSRPKVHVVGVGVADGVTCSDG